MNEQDVVTQLIENLSSPNLETRMEAAKRLGELRDDRAIEPLVRAALNYQGPFYEFEEIVDALLQFPDAAVPVLIEALKTGNFGYQGYAAQILAYFKDDRALSPLLDCLDEGIKDIMTFITHALASYGEKAVRPLIERVQTHPNPFVRHMAMYTLSYISSPSVALFAEQQLNNSDNQSRAIIALGDPNTVVDMDQRLGLIIPFLNSDNSKTRLSAIHALGKLGDERSVELLIEQLDLHPGFATETTVIQALGWIGSSKAVDTLTDFLNGPFQQLAVTALEEIGDKRAIPALLSVRESSERSFRYQINGALKKLGYFPADYADYIKD
ncbi:MAG: HEAT repeat domain-containing protein [Anaerolineaceae bacterium]|nr:HEAT repeat domain-containing protein [Anaerolineaceae bacterium]